jgi:hypothetical protein
MTGGPDFEYDFGGCSIILGCALIPVLVNCKFFDTTFYTNKYNMLLSPIVELNK